MDDNNVQNSLCITSMKQELSGPTEAPGPFIYICNSEILCPTKYTVVSSAKRTVLLCIIAFGMSFEYIMNNSGPNTLP